MRWMNETCWRMEGGTYERPEFEEGRSLRGSNERWSQETKTWMESEAGCHTVKDG